MTSPEFDYTKHHMSNEVKNILIVWFGGAAVGPIVEITMNDAFEQHEQALEWHRILTSPDRDLEPSEQMASSLGWFLLESYGIESTQSQEVEDQLMLPVAI